MKISRFLFVVAIAITALSGCQDKYSRPGRQHPGGGGSQQGTDQGQQQQTVTARENKTWSVSYDGRQTITGGQKVDVFSTTVPNNVIYLVSILPLGDYREYNNDKVKFMQNELDWVMGMDAEDQKMYVYTGAQTIYINPVLTHGDWYAFIIALDSDNKLTGEYSYLSFEVEEEEPTPEFQKWLGTWRVSGKTDGRPAKDVTYKLSIESEEANYMYRVYGWETLEEEDDDWEQMNLESLVTFYDGGDMYFTAQYITTYDDEEFNDTVEEVFLGEVYYKGAHATPDLYIIESEDIDLARATLSQDGLSAALEPVEVTAWFGDDNDGEEYTTVFYDMKYFYWSRNDMQWYVYNQNVAIFPFTMEKITSEPAPALTKASSSITRGQRIRPVRAKVYVPKSEKKVVKAVKRR